MKIRIKGNSLRYRLTKTDVAQFKKQGYVEELMNLGPQQLTYALQRTITQKLTASFQNNKITLLMPEAMADEWTSTDCVGFEHSTPLLFLLVEKDFKCLDEVGEDQSDNYPNPLAKNK